jgi:hypothetical protein
MSEQLELFPQEEIEQDFNEVNIPEVQPIADAEWCFQFFNNEPIVFAWSNENEKPTPLVLELQPTNGDGLNFQQSGMTFKIFPRPISEETKKQRAEQNASKNKEA